MVDLVCLETVRRTAFVKTEHFMFVFYGLEKAYDCTWGMVYCTTCTEWDYAGEFPSSISSTRSYCKIISVRIGDYLFVARRIENEVQQESALSVTLFALKINYVFKLVLPDANLLVSLYVNDLQTEYDHSDVAMIQEKMQQCLDAIHTWASNNGFTFSSSKSKAMHFWNLKPSIKVKQHSKKTSAIV